MEEAGMGGGWCWNVKMLFNYRVDELSFKNTVNSLESDPPLGAQQNGCLREVVVYQKNQEN